MANISLKHANGIDVGSRALGVLEGGIPVGSMVRAIITWNQTAREGSNPIETIVVSSAALERIVAVILGDCI